MKTEAEFEVPTWHQVHSLLISQAEKNPRKQFQTRYSDSRFERRMVSSASFSRHLGNTYRYRKC